MSKFSNVWCLLWQTGAGAQESSLKDDRGSQPPKQYAPTPHDPYCEQQGASEGHLLSSPQLGAAAKAVEAEAKTATRVEVRTIMYIDAKDTGKQIKIPIESKDYWRRDR